MQQSEGQISDEEAGVISPPEKFSVVEQGLYRSALPRCENVAYVRSLQLRRVIVLSEQRIGRSMEKLLAQNNIMVSHIGLRGAMEDASWRPMPEEVVKESIEMMLSEENYPLLVCDVGGVHVVGMVIGCLRRLTGWNLTSVVSEYRLFAGAKTRYVNEQFIELFDTDLVCIPERERRAAWLCAQKAMEMEEIGEYERLVREGRVDGAGARVDDTEMASYRRYYYSSCSPLNSTGGASTPRIRLL
ncbi:hypothetical protein BWQ96_00766 [Gracilariopsis chorda]|uniref:Tyrosine-protein phosphatase n=1 Tax=Gracilariopsis chorda TaxID=448386 RepID=A0A2V3J8V3_9FLOR|nr:hypothetical protein BWQ96_00766 [Gracilariopsis chorda]|eukprot:PXF49450.1 hypothetical protein BWQ96_00766 [Gracilariopsis chorda]